MFEGAKRLLKRAVLSSGVFISRQSSPTHILSLIRCLAPFETEHRLIRYGGENDGGYLIPYDLDGIVECFSPGVDVCAEFEKDLLSKNDIVSHLADYSIDAPPPGVNAASFQKKFIGSVDNEKFISMDSWVSAVSIQGCSDSRILQMDIEGGEYAALLTSSRSVLASFRIIVLEVHFGEHWGNPAFLMLAQACFDKLLQDFVVVHNHPNNCCGVVSLQGVEVPRVFELTLLRRDRVHQMSPAVSFPHPEDSPNIPDRRDLILPSNWYGVIGEDN